MFPVQIPAFGETTYFDNQANNAVRSVLIPDADAESFAAYCALLEKEGFTSREAFAADHRRFLAYEKDGWGVFINYFALTDQLQLVMEENTAYFSYVDRAGEEITTPRLTQLYLNDYGLSDVIRLPDGRLIIIDGACVYETDVDNLFARLKKDSPHETPVVAAWIFTHAHSDHYFCFFPFMEKYGEQVTVEKLLFNFPKEDDTARFVELSKNETTFAKWLGIETITGGEVICRLHQKVTQLGIPVYTPHTGQTYRVGEAKFCFLAGIDDSIHCAKNINETSLMFTMELGGQKIFFAGDGFFSSTYLAERYGAELKVDILQIPHHGFGAGTVERQIQGYLHMQPQVCLLPVSLEDAYTTFTTYREGTQYLMTAMDIQEMITGETERTLELPYTADPAGALQLRQRYLEGRDNSGARTWIFTDLNTGNKEDFVFTVLNTTYLSADISVELYFENARNRLYRVQTKALGRGVFRVNCLLKDKESVAVLEEPDFMAQRGIPENTAFAVRFTSSLPVVISHRAHQPAYRSSVV